MTAALTFHLPTDAAPDALRAIFHVLATADGGVVTPMMLRGRVADVLGKQPRGEALTLAEDLGLIQQTGSGIAITGRGQAVATSGEVADLVHGLCYFAWSAENAARLSRMWTYRSISDLLWDLAPARIDAALKKQLVEDVLGRAEREFDTTDGFQSARTSVGPRTIDGALRWLEQLAPPIVHEKRIERRQRCPPRLMVLSVAAMIQRSGAVIGTDFRLGNEERTLLCRACFLEATALDAMLEWTVQSQPHRLRWGTLNARYGRQLVLQEPAFPV